MLKVLDLDYNELLSKCNLELENIEEESRISIPSQSDIEFLNNLNFNQIWKVETGLYDDVDSKWLVEDLVLYIGFSKDFPYAIPKIYIDKKDIDKIGTIPHITLSNCDVCVFDNFTITNPTNPIGIVIETIKKTKTVISEGIKKENFSDFDDEFTAYWVSENKISGKRFYFSIIQSYPKDVDFLKALKYPGRDKDSLNYIIYNDKEKEITKYQQYLEANKIEYEEKLLFFLREINTINTPPFHYDYSESLKLIPKKKKEKFKQYFNQIDSEKTVLFLKEIKGQEVLAGWCYSLPNKNIKGFRPAFLSDYRVSFNKQLPEHKKIIKKFNISNLNQDRLVKRTSTEKVNFPNYKFLVAGLGSVGSNLIYFLNNINFPHLTLVDNDSLQSENIGRHLLGFEYLNFLKADAVHMYLSKKYPSQHIKSFNTSFIDLYYQHPEIYNNQDYIFLCTGSMNLEHLLCNEIANKNLKKPIFIIWVEPYLLGGQCIFITPEDPINIKDYYSDVYKFNHSIIKHSEYDTHRDLFIQKEIGCQTSFSPYSSTHLTLFLASIFPEIFNSIKENLNKSTVFSWVGDLELAREMGIEVNYNDESFKIIKRDL